MDPIVDLVIRIKNAYAVGKEQVVSPYSRYREDVLRKLKSLRYIHDYAVEGDVVKRFVISLSYRRGSPALRGVKLFSTPGRRWYIPSKKLAPIMGGMGYAFLSTSRGIMTNIEAKKEHVGGELLFHVW